MTVTSSTRFLEMRRVWNPSTDGLPQPRTDQKRCVEYWGLRPDNIMQDWMVRLRRMVARKIAHVSMLDQELRHLSMASVRVQGVASEHRAGRTIVGLDINGACSYAVANVPVPNPKLLEPREGKDCRPDDPDWSGFYLIEAHAPKFWCTPPVPVRSAQGFFVCAQASYPFSMWIHTSEWGIWNKLFDCTIVRGFEGPAMVHPLANVARGLHQQKVSWPDPDAKMLLSSMHSCMGSRWSMDNQGCTKAIWSLHHMPLAWVRGQWLRQWHRVMQTYPDALLCYANVDSMHWSIDAAQYHANPLHNTNTWGSWRQLFEGDKGMWLATGKYWIAKNGRIVHHQNAGSLAPWRTKIRHRIDTKKYPGYRPWYSTYAWHGLASATKLVRKERALVQHILPTLQSVQSEHGVAALRMRSIVHDRLWKKKLWFLLKRDCNEETQNS